MWIWYELDINEFDHLNAFFMLSINSVNTKYANYSLNNLLTENKLIKNQIFQEFACLQIKVADVWSFDH